MDIENAKAFIIERTLQPAIDSPLTTKRIKDLTKSTIVWIRQFRRTGDLIDYISRFQGDAPTEIADGFAAVGIPTFEDISAKFAREFSASRNDKTRVGDFVIGERYTAYDIHIAAKNYNLRSGGILPIGEVGNHIAVFIKVTFQGGTYPNEWLEVGKRLKYYLKKVGKTFNENFQANRAISDYPSVPIFAFVRQAEREAFTLSGVFEFGSIHSEDDGSKWFELVRSDQEALQPTVTMEQFTEDAERGIATARRLSVNERRARLKAAAKTPKRRLVQMYAYARNPDVIVEVLDRADGSCEACFKAAPFARRRNGKPYLEVHHKIPLSLGGEDTVENALALCPNCHRQEHYGDPRWYAGDADLPIEIE